MRRSFSRFGWVVSLFLLASPAVAGPYSDDLAKCLVASTTSEEKTLLVQWMFATMSLHPQVKHLTNVSPAERTRLNRRVAVLFESLLTRSCLGEAREALKNEGVATFEASFNVLGQVAGRELATSPDVAAGFAERNKFVDAQKVQRALAAR